jgi:hypothetical protein
MSTLRRALALAALAAMTACGGGGSGSQSAIVPSTSKPASVSNATATLTLKFPAHVAKAKAAATARKPAYINPGGGSLVITALGTTLMDPANPANGFFSLGTQNLTTGVSVLTIPLVASGYSPGDLTITEYDGQGTGNALAYGQNQNFFNVTAGSVATPSISMSMVIAGIALTTDPINGSDAFVLNTGSPGNIQCTSSGGTYWAFPVDATNTFELPGSPTAPGDTSGIPNPTLASQTPIGGPAQWLGSTLGSNVFTLSDPGGSQSIESDFSVTNPVDQFKSTPFGFTDPVQGWVQIGPGTC